MSVHSAKRCTLLLILCTMPALGIAAEHEVVITQYRFVPAELEISVGDEVRWVNAEKRTSHSVLFVASGEESERLFPGEKWSARFETAGRFEYRCGPHPEMNGVITVKP